MLSVWGSMALLLPPSEPQCVGQEPCRWITTKILTTAQCEMRIGCLARLRRKKNL